MTDPFAAAAAQQAPAQTVPAGAVEDPFASAHDLDDPFATSEDFRGGPFTPTPPIELLRGRLVVMVPRKFDPLADNPFKDQPGAEPTREQYTVDMYVLDGGPLTFDYKVKGDPNKGTQDTYETYDAGTPTAEQPFVMMNNWIPQGNLINKLKGCHRKGAPYLAVLEVGAQANDRKKGTSDAQIRTEFDAWIKRNRVGNKPKYSWLGDVPSDERRRAAIAFWAAHKAGIDPINTATAPQLDR